MQLNHILFPVDFSGRSLATAPFVHSMAQRYGAAVTLLHVIPPPVPAYFDITCPEPGEPSPAVEAWLGEFEREQFPKSIVRCVVMNGEPAAAILALAREARADLIAMPTRGYRLFRRLLLGSVTAQVLRESPVPVWTSAHVCDQEHRAHPKPRRIVAALDLKEDSANALRTALSIANDAGASVEVLHIAPEGTVSASQPGVKVQRAVAKAAAGGAVEVESPPFSDVRIATHGEDIASLVGRTAREKNADLVVIGRGGIHGHVLDRLHSHAYSVICESPCPVLSV